MVRVAAIKRQACMTRDYPTPSEVVNTFVGGYRAKAAVIPRANPFWSAAYFDVYWTGEQRWSHNGSLRAVARHTMDFVATSGLHS